MLTRSALLVAGLLTATGALAQTPNTSPVLPLGRFNVWLYSGAAAQAFLDEGPHPGVSSVSFGQPQMHPSLVAAFHERGIAVLDGIGGSQGCVSERSWKAQLDAKIKAGSDAIYVNEPWACPAPPGGFPGGAMDPANIAGLVEQYNPIHDYLLAERPGAVFGFCGGDQNWHIALLQAGLREEFACVEQYNGSHIHYMDALKTRYPCIKTIALEYGTTALCSYGMGSAVVTGEENEITYFDTWAAYDTTNTLSVSAGPIIDVSWKKNFLAFAATQKREFCKLPYSRVYAPITWAAQASDITIFPIDVKLASSAKYTLAKCEYSVESNAVETVPWKPRVCQSIKSGASSHITLTVGAGKDCRDNGVFSSAASPAGIAPCQIFLRSWTTDGAVGTETATRFNIHFLP